MPLKAQGAELHHTVLRFRCLTMLTTQGLRWFSLVEFRTQSEIVRSMQRAKYGGFCQ